MAKGETQRVVLGAGKWYVAEWESGEVDLDTVAVEDNLMGYTQGGATISYTPELKDIEDDIGMVKKRFKTMASAEMKTGLLTFNLEALHRIMSFGEYAGGETGRKTLKLSGGKEALKKFCVVFVYEDDETKETIRVGMVASNTATLELAFTKDTETVIDITFSAESNGIDDVILVIDEGAAAA